jgi:hypothetical protein
MLRQGHIKQQGQITLGHHPVSKLHQHTSVDEWMKHNNGTNNCQHGPTAAKGHSKHSNGVQQAMGIKGRPSRCSHSHNHTSMPLFKLEVASLLPLLCILGSCTKGMMKVTATTSHQTLLRL